VLFRSMLAYSNDEIIKLSKVYDLFMSGEPDKWLIIAPYCLMALVTVFTALSGIRYLITNWHLFLSSKNLKEKSKD
jgi:hypothetical protein